MSNSSNRITRDIKCDCSRNTTETKTSKKNSGFERSQPEFFSGLCFSSVTAAFAFDISKFYVQHATATFTLHNIKH